MTNTPILAARHKDTHQSPFISVLCISLVLVLLLVFLYFYLTPVIRDPRVILPRDTEAQTPKPKSKYMLKPLELPLPSMVLRPPSEASLPPPVYASRPSTPAPAYSSPHLSPRTAYDIPLNQRRSSDSAVPPTLSERDLPRRNSSPGSATANSLSPTPLLRVSPGACPVELQVQGLHVPSRALVCNGNSLGTSGLGLVPSIWKRSSLNESGKESNTNVGKPF
ncbi:hypothetical protein BDZ89DRAFT_1059570 [Hymenopellis radicata]|nr:hypothetical protein BDZ89DRAFT_1059570 [Hymenopellis radicata]